MLQKLNNRAARFVIDGIAAAAGLIFAYNARYDGAIPAFERQQLLYLLLPVVLGRLLIELPFGLHRHKWRYINLADAARITAAYGTFSLLLLVLRLSLPAQQPYLLFRIPMGVIAMEFFISLIAVVAVRALRRELDRRAPRQELQSTSVRKIILVGAGSHGATLANEMVRSRGMNVVGFLDDDHNKIGAVIAGVPVLGPVALLRDMVTKHQVDEVLICIPPSARNRVPLDLSNGHASVRARIIPTVSEILESNHESERYPARRLVRPPVNGAAQALYSSYPSTSLSGKTIVITGGGGFIGSRLAEILAPANKVVLVDIGFRGPVSFTGLLTHPNVRIVEGNILDSSDIRSVCNEADMVVHAAALIGVNRVCNAGRETLETNYVGTSRLLQGLEGSRRLERLVYFSTSEVFGVNSFRVSENSPPSVGPIAESRWSYAIAKLAGEHLVKAYFRELKMPVTIVRPFNVFGPRRTGDYALRRFILNGLTDRPIEVHGDGSQIRSWCFVDDFCSAVIAMLEKPEAIGEDFNIGNASNTLTIYDLARKVLDICESDAPIKLIDHPFPDISIRVPSLEKAQSLLGYRPRYDIDHALQLTVDWYREHLSFFGEEKALAASAAR